ncbi:Predicted 5' DNA nuclease, flap endonuclease-1-like, helix-3-turn-helix (H3TH) domain [Devosia crocina]|uniref:Predicted 5' DNA nuclease, flap endonuclease-1-like, helix-3-turn-helix (H3TH) domain n=1 Tax=Devosia crocina TaxID=429728 RepID=A0A1I7N9K4_9HYPH|nr:hypothetical protein [Devosia crocina]SFV31350.1 Predicted 5' DNA nuclease, flap endonuclease-1-like, helix-3-turn-helix (H3TH) domain [Devosia crocina]
MALIECKLGPTETNVGGQGYVFSYDELRRAVSKVHDLVHIKCFLSVQHYQEVPTVAEVLAARATAPAPELKTSIETLLGSTVLPDEIVFSPAHKLTLGYLVSHTVAESGLTPEEWNGLTQDEREQRLDATVDAIQAQVDREIATEAQKAADAQALKDAEAARIAEAAAAEAEAQRLAEAEAAAAAAAEEAAAAERLAKSKEKVIDPIVDIAGLGPATAAKLAELDITSFSQIAAWDEQTIAMLDTDLGLKGAIKRGDWVGQAKVFQQLKDEAAAEAAAKAAQQNQG